MFLTLFYSHARYEEYILNKKYEDFQFSIINESKALKTETGTKCQEKLQRTYISRK